ncbi:endonuclease/exonuclease/phosphatase family protein [Rhizobium sp. L1K21]|uniref:endonuclease/exonuclease/phosphatase family protein n=1 Tax=Rhizobium sp. L1K21 TaxID=2954933 RepID=UPI0020925021|nr:endonuclease/exonuclease/phosphatase family protein [Rhizobium sp. L1K21]MCO6185733.1 endonuclease [Rhizobium sp. L1K21]
MTLRLATFNVENLMNRFDFSGHRNDLRRDRVLQLFDIQSKQEFERLEEARFISSTDDTRQMTAQAIFDADADILCLQEVDNIEALKAFEYGYLFRMMGAGYRQKYLIEGNDSRGIDVALMMRDETRTGEKIELIDIRSHARVTYDELGLFNRDVAVAGEKPTDQVFKRDCLEADIRVGRQRLTLYIVHFKSIGGARGGGDPRLATMAIRQAEAQAVRHIISKRFGSNVSSNINFAICGDMNDYEEKLMISGDKRNGYSFAYVEEETKPFAAFSSGGFAENIVQRRPRDDRWTHYHARGPEERHLCQLDYIWLSPHLARTNRQAIPEIIRAGQAYRTIFPPGQEVERYPRVGWDRPKASDHCPVVVELALT